MSFRTRLTLSSVALSIVPLLLLGVILAVIYRQTLSDQIHGSLTSDAESIQQLVEQGLVEREKNVQGWADDAIIRGALIYGSFEKSDLVLRELSDRYRQYRSIVLFSAEGVAVSASDDRLKARYAADAPRIAAAPWFRAALGGNPSYHDLERDEAAGAVVLRFARAIRSPSDGRSLGVLMAAYDWAAGMQEKATPALARANERGHESYEILVGKTDGAVLYDSGGPAESSSWTGQPIRGALTGLGQRGVVTHGDRLMVAVRNSAGSRADWVFFSVVSKDEAYAPITTSLLLSLIPVLGFGILAAVIAFTLGGRLVRPINSLNTVMERIVREGDLTQRLEIETSDEIGQLAATFAEMVRKLREIPASLQELTQLLAESVANLNASAAEQTQTLSRQAAALQETQVTVQEIRQTSLVASQKSANVLQVAERADQIGRSGERAIEESLSGLGQIRVEVAEIADKITALTDRTRQIGLITETVKDIADQSNILALNAAIEAVRSGEHGKGFTVVAREIRSLADQSIQATNRVREILEDTSSAIRTAVAITEKGAEKMEGGLVQVRTSGESLRELSGIVRDNSAAVRQIAAAVSQQNAGISQISAAVDDLNSLMSDTMKRLEATTNAANVLKEVSGRMSSIVASYRI